MAREFAFLQDLLVRLPTPLARWGRLLGLSVIVGALAGIAARLLELGLHFGSELLIGRFAHPGGADVLNFRPELLILPALGGLASGLIVYWLCPSVRGQGTDLLIRAFHREGGVMRIRGPVVKAAASIGVISCGGSAGPEGPIAALGAAIGSALGRVFTLTPRERRIMLLAGCGAGVGAIFQCPLGGALFATGVLYRDPDFETDAIVPAFVASVIGYSIYGYTLNLKFVGYGQHLFEEADLLVFRSPMELIPYAVLGPLCGLFCAVYRYALVGVERIALRSRLPSWLTPALGGLATGLVACALPQVMDGQYYFIRNAMDGNFTGGFQAASWWWWALLFGAVALAKCVATGLTIGSGASGGVLGPAVFIGGATGAVLGALIQAVGPELFTSDPENLRRALIPVGMAGVLAASMRIPLASLVMVTEMTGSYELIVPLMLVCVTSYVVGRRWGLNDEQVRSAADSPVHAGDAIVHMLEQWHVQDLVRTDWAETVRPDATLSDMVARIRPGTRPVFAVTDNGRIAGLISVPDIERIMEEPGAAEVIIAADMMTHELTTVYPDDDAYHALAMMSRENHIVLPVVSRDRERRFLGMMTRADVYEAVRREFDAMRAALLSEHAGLGVIEHEEKLDQIVMGVSSRKRENIQRLLVPLQAVGKSLRESDFRRQFGIQVIAIELPDGSIQCPPDADAPLRTEQRLVAIVTEEGQDGRS
ncbi:MAG: chloride channel protein [Phycisphaerae bacterium]|nr:chloride channel protein [Phycisphaerae bacterium]